MWRGAQPTRVEDMSETPSGTATPPPPPSSSPPPPSLPPPPPPSGGDGWDTEHLKDYRLLRRSAGDRKVAGVAGGLARHLDIDPTVLRVLFVVMIFFGGAGLLVYGVMWLLVPDEKTGRAVIRSNDSTRNAVLIGTLVLAALVAIGDTWNGYGFPWPLALAAIVVFAVLLSRDSRQGPPTPGSQGDMTGPGQDPPSGPEAPIGTTTSGWVPAETTSYTAYYPPSARPPAPPGAPPYMPPPPPARPRKRGPLLFGITLALVAFGLGILGLVDASGSDVSDAAYAALALAIIGAMLVLGSVFGRPGGLVLLGLLASLALGGAAIGNPSYDGERNLMVQPTEAADLGDRYEVPAGRIELDLTEIKDLEQLDGRTIELEANVGDIVVDVPRDVTVNYLANVNYGGAVDAPGVSRGGWDFAEEGEMVAREPQAEIDLRMDMDFGHIELRRE